MVLLWVLRRNCSLAPRQLLGAVMSVSAVSLAIALFFWALGAPLVLPFAGLEGLALVAAVFAYGRHAADSETLTLRGGRLEVEHHCGHRVERATFRAAFVRVEPRHADASLVELTGQGRRAHVGRYLHPRFRPALAQELRRALRGEAAVAPETDLETK